MRLLEVERQQRRLTQAQLADMIGVSERTYRAYVHGQLDMHPDFRHQIARKLCSPELALCAMASQDNPLAPRLLDVDTHVSTEILVAGDELAEALEAINSIDPCKRLNRQDLKRVADQVLDLMHAIPHFLVALAEASQLDLWAVAEANAHKLQARGYLKTQREEVAKVA